MLINQTGKLSSCEAKISSAREESFLHFAEREASLPLSQDPSIFSHPESDKNILRFPILFLEDAF
jgi:hypothetical protein